MIKEDGTVEFDEAEQKEVDRIIGERLARAKTEKPEDYEDLKEIAEALEGFGYSGTPSEKKAAIKAYKAKLEAEQNADNFNKTTSFEEDEIIKAIKTEYETKKQAEKEAKEKEAAWNKQVEEFNGEYPDITVEDLENNKEFLEFVEGSGWTLKQAYTKFVKVYGEIEAKATQKVTSKLDRSTSSGKGGGDSNRIQGLSQAQIDQLEQWNKNNPQYKMTAKEFKERLG